MKNDRKKYTFEDWLSGIITNNDVTMLTINNALNKENGTNEPYLPEKESKKIREYKNQTFRRAVEIKATTKIRVAREELGVAKNPLNWLNLEIKKAQNFIENNPELEQIFEKYEIDELKAGFVRIDSAKRINEMYVRFKNDEEYRGYTGFSIKKNGKWVPHRLSDMYVNKIYLDELSRMLTNLKGVKIDIQLLQKIVLKANDLLTKQQNDYRPLKSGAFISNDLKNRLAEDFNLGATTINDWLKSYCDKEKHLFKIKPEYAVLLKSE